MPLEPSTRGVQQKQEITSREEWRDIRTWSQRFRAWVEGGDALVFMAVMVLALMWLLPQLIEATWLGGLLLFWWASRQEFSLPFRMPKTSRLVDHNDPIPTKGGGLVSGPSDGISFLGNEKGTRKELWLKNDDMRTHLLVFGSTGSGKALRDDERVLTPQGWRRMDSLVEGDWVMTPQGEPTRVLGVYPQGELALWDVSLEDGRRLEACGEHLWEALDPDGRPQVLRTHELAERLSEAQAAGQGVQDRPHPGWRLPMPGPLPLPADRLEADAQVEPMLRRLQLGLGLPQAERGSIEQRQRLVQRLRERWGVKLAEQSRESWRFEHEASARWMQTMLRSLGALAQVRPQTQGWELAAQWGRSDLAVSSVTALGRSAPCRCIEIADPRGLFVAGEMVATHNTEALISLAFNSLIHGSGFIYVDGKGDNMLWAKIYSICRSVGREDDLLVINYMTGGRDVFGPQKNKMSNTLNPFSTASAGGLTELLVGLMDEAGGDAAMWKGRAITLISGVMFALVYMRENEGLLLDVDKIRHYLILENIEKLADRKDLPPRILESIRAYLRSLPGYVEKQPLQPPTKQSETVLDQHGYLQMQFTRILGSLSDTYGYIFRTNLGEVDFFDVVINRRILVVLLPALEKSPDELGNLGKIIVACLKQMMATGLGDTLEGDFQDIIEIKPTNAPAPYTCILDEYGYYVVKGAAVMPAQARSLGFSMIFAGQDYPAFKKNNNTEEAVSTIGNCNIKIFMKVEDPTDTFDLFKQSVGEALVSKTGGFSIDSGGLSTVYRDEKKANIERRSRGDYLDLKDQRAGEAHIIFKSALVRAQLFFADPAKIKRIQLNHFLRVEPPMRKDMQLYEKNINNLQQNLTNPGLLADLLHQTTPLARLATAQAMLEERQSHHASPAAAIAAAIAAAHRLSTTALDAVNQQLEEQSQAQASAASDLAGGTMNLFSDPSEFGDYGMPPVSAPMGMDGASPYGASGMPVGPGNYDPLPGGYAPSGHPNAPYLHQAPRPGQPGRDDYDTMGDRGYTYSGFGRDPLARVMNQPAPAYNPADVDGRMGAGYGPGAGYSPPHGNGYGAPAGHGPAQQGYPLYNDTSWDGDPYDRGDPMDQEENDGEDEPPYHPSMQHPTFLEEGRTRRSIKAAEIASGVPNAESERRANALVAEMGRVSTYPNPDNLMDATNPQDVIDIIQEIGKSADEASDR